MPDFNDILNVKTEDVKRPVPLPTGDFQATIKAVNTGTSAQKRTPYAEIVFSSMMAIELDDEDALAVYEDFKKLSETEFKDKFYLTDNSTFRLKDFLTDHVGLAGEGRTLLELLSDAIGENVGIKIGHRPSQDGEQMFAEAKNYFKV